MPFRLIEHKPVGSPVHAHDCAECVFMFSDRAEGGPVDLYVCPKQLGGLLTIVCRFGSDGPDYFSGPPEMWTAALRCFEPDTSYRRYALMVAAYAMWAQRRIPKEAPA